MTIKTSVLRNQNICQLSFLFFQIVSTYMLYTNKRWTKDHWFNGIVILTVILYFVGRYEYLQIYVKYVCHFQFNYLQKQIL